MKEGFAGSALILPIASPSVPIALGLAGAWKPIWLSLICRKVSLLGSAASAPSMIPSERGTPPEIVHSTPVPAQVMHSSAFRRLRPLPPSSFLQSLIVVSPARMVRNGPLDTVETGRGGALFPAKAEDRKRRADVVQDACFRALRGFACFREGNV